MSDDPGGVVVAIDGPAGAGKSTVARELARRLGVAHLDTGAMYRAVTFAALQRDVPVTDAGAIAALARDLDLAVEDDAVTVDGHDAARAIRGAAVTTNVSAVAANAGVRAELVRRQRHWVAEHGGGVVEGRDIGSVVLTDAPVKVYVTASPRVRAERRVGEIGGDVTDVAAAIAARDEYDSSRADSPLRVADGAHVIDTSDRAVDDIVDEILGLVAAR